MTYFIYDHSAIVFMSWLSQCHVWLILFAGSRRLEVRSSCVGQAVSDHIPVSDDMWNSRYLAKRSTHPGVCRSRENHPEPGPVHQPGRDTIFRLDCSSGMSCLLVSGLPDQLLRDVCVKYQARAGKLQTSSNRKCPCPACERSS